jgi:hypothetical protein
MSLAVAVLCGAIGYKLPENARLAMLTAVSRGGWAQGTAGDHTVTWIAFGFPAI